MVNEQVFASLLVSVLLAGFKLNAAKEIVQTIERRKELKCNLSLLQSRLEDEAKDEWIDDVLHDAKELAERIAAMEPASGLSYSGTENELVKRGMAVFEAYDSSLEEAREMKRSASIDRLETKLDKQTGLLLGRADAEICASPQEIVAYTLNYCHSRVGQAFAATDPNHRRSEHLETVHGCHSRVFIRIRAPGISDRTFLNSIVAKRVEEDPVTHVLVVVPIPRHDGISKKDEAHAVRGENYRSYRITAVAPGRSKVEYVCCLDVKGWVPQIVTNTVALPQQMNGAQP